MQNFAFKFQAVAEKAAKNVKGYFILPHPVYSISGSCVSLALLVLLFYRRATVFLVVYLRGE